ncbi:MAG: helix-turn-helix transcriptional regulator, partial [Planctomycetes bacterium]|nr:helix-turn-helix transcriptional regulator [Planctomycetota bacterium]
LAAARRARYLELLAEVEANRLSRLTAERLRVRMTQAELAKRAGMAQPNISRLEKPGAAMSVSTARKLGKALGLDDYRVLLP